MHSLICFRIPSTLPLPRDCQRWIKIGSMSTMRWLCHIHALSLVFMHFRFRFLVEILIFLFRRDMNIVFCPDSLRPALLYLLSFRLSFRVVVTAWFCWYILLTPRLFILCSVVCVVVPLPHSVQFSSLFFIIILSYFIYIILVLLLHSLDIIGEESILFIVHLSVSLSFPLYFLFSLWLLRGNINSATCISFLSWFSATCIFFLYFFGIAGTGFHQWYSDSSCFSSII